MDENDKRDATDKELLEHAEEIGVGQAYNFSKEAIETEIEMTRRFGPMKVHHWLRRRIISR